jgi:hypothetical protein
MTQPTMTCDKCGLQRTVTKSPEATLAWFKKWHYKHCDGTPQYRAGLQLGITQLEGQS